MPAKCPIFSALLLFGACAESSIDIADTSTGTPDTEGTGDTGDTADSNGGPVLLKSDLPRDRNPLGDPVEAQLLIDENHQLASDLYAAVDTSQNVALSPLSFQYAFSLLHVGAAGETASQLAHVLTKSSNVDQVPVHYNALDLELSSRNATDESEFGELSLKFANAMFARPDFNPGKAYLDSLATHFGAGLYLEDFAGDPELARQHINTWVEENTNGRIKDLLAPGVVNEATNFHLVNALYFKAAWREPFPPGLTTEDDFYVDDGDVAVASQTMHADFLHAIRYAKLEGGEQVVEMELGSGDLVFGALLAEKGKFASVAEKFTPTFFNELDESLARAGVHLSLPKFAVKFGSASFFEYFAENQGLEAAFNEGDYSKMFDTGAEKSFPITSLEHQAFVAIDENGVEATAATSLGSDESGTDVWHDVVFNRPFFYYIRDLPTGAVLFVGSVVDPR
jgi:serpin B